MDFGHIMRCSCSSILNLRPLSVCKWAMVQPGSCKIDVKQLPLENKSAKKHWKNIWISKKKGNPKVDFDLLGWVWTGSPGAFASAKHRKQHVTFIPDPLDSPKDHSKTSSKENAKFAWLAFHARILSCSEGLGGPLNSTPHNLSKVHWCVEERNIWPQHATAHERNQKPSKNQEVEMHQGLKSWLPSFPGERLSPQSPKS